MDNIDKQLASIFSTKAPKAKEPEQDIDKMLSNIFQSSSTSNNEPRKATLDRKIKEDRLKQDERKAVAAENPGAGVIAATARGFTKTTTFNQAEEIIGALDPNRTVEQEERRSAYLAEKHPIATAIGSGLGYLAIFGTGAGQAAKGLSTTGKILKGATEAATQVGIVEGGSKTIDNAKRWISGEIDGKQFLSETVGDTAKASAAAFVGGAAVGGALLGGGKLLRKVSDKVTGWRLAKLPAEVQEIAKAADDIAAQRAGKVTPEAIETLGKKSLDYYNGLKESLNAQISASASSFTDDTLGLVGNLDDIINKQADEVATLLKERNYGSIKNNLVKTKELIDSAAEQVKTVYGIEIDKIVSKVPKDAKFNIESVSDTVKQGLLKAYPKNVQVGAGGKIIAENAPAKMRDLLEIVNSKKPLSFAQADKLRDTIDEFIPFGGDKAFNEGHQLLNEARSFIRNELADPAKFGDAAVAYDSLLNGYSQTMGFRKALSSAKNFMSTVEANVSDSDWILKNAKEFEKKIASAKTSLNEFGKAGLVEFNPTHKAVLQETLNDARAAVDIAKVVKNNGGRKTIENLISGKPITDEAAKRFASTYEELYAKPIQEALGFKQKYPQYLARLLKNPDDLVVQKDFKDFIKAGFGGKKDELASSLINKANTYRRMNASKAFDDLTSFADDLIKNKIARPDELSKALGMTDSIAELRQFYNQARASKLAEKWQSKLSGAVTKPGTQSSEIIGKIGLGAAVFGKLNPSLAAAYYGVLGTYRLAYENPQALNIYLKQLGMNDKLINKTIPKIMRYTALASGIAASGEGKDVVK